MADVDRHGRRQQHRGDVEVAGDGAHLRGERRRREGGCGPAEAGQAVYEVEAGRVTLTGDVVLTRGENVLAGERMVVDLGAGTAAVEGRVRSVFQPGAQ